MTTRIRRTPEQARLHILATAEDYLQKNGPGSFNVKEIAQHGGMAHANVLHHFGSVENLKTEIGRHFLNRFMADAVQTMEQDEDGVPLDKVIELFIERLQNDETAHLISWVVFNPPEPDLTVDPDNRPVESMLRRLSDLIAERIEGDKKQRSKKAIQQNDAILMLLATSLIGHLVIGPYVGKSLKMAEGQYGDKYFEWLSSTMFSLMKPDQS